MPTTITSIIGQAVVVTTQANIAPIYPETKSLSVPEVKPMLSQEPSHFIISSSLDSEALSQLFVLSPEALVVNVSLIASTSTQSVHTSLCSVIPTVSVSSSPSSHCYGEGIFVGLFTPIPKSVTTPVNMEVFRLELAGYPDLTMKDYLLNGFTHGFDISYIGPHRAVQCQNQLSASANSEHITEVIKKELLCGHTAGPFLSPRIFTVPPWVQSPRKMGLRD